MQQMSCQSLLGQSDDLIPPTMSITSDVLDFLGYEGKEGEKRKNFKRLLERAEVPYRQIKFVNTTSKNQDAKIVVEAKFVSTTR